MCVGVCVWGCAHKSVLVWSLEKARDENASESRGKRNAVEAEGKLSEAQGHRK